MPGLLSLGAVLFLAANPYLEQGRQAYLRLEYDRAESALRLAQKVPGNSREEVRAVDDLLARTLVAEGRLDEAEAIYGALLARDSRAPAPADAAPKIQRIFQRAKQRVYPAHFASLEPRPTAPGTVLYAVVDPWDEVKSVRCGARALDLVEGEARGACDAGAEVLALDARGTPLARARTELQPAAVVSAPSPRPAVASPPVSSAPLGAERGPVAPSPGLRPAWYLVGATAILAGAAVGLAVSSQADARGLTDPGSAASAASIYSRANTKNTVAWVAGGGAVATAVTSIILFRFGP